MKGTSGSLISFALDIPIVFVHCILGAYLLSSSNANAHSTATHGRRHLAASDATLVASVRSLSHCCPLCLDIDA